MGDLSDISVCRRWTVLIGSFWSLFQSNIIIYGLGAINLLLLERFGQGEAYTSLVGSIYAAFFCFCGILAGAFINVFSCRVVCIIGCVMNVIGLVLTAFVPSLDLTIITLGVIAGLGQSFQNGASICAIVLYAKERQEPMLSLSFIVIGFSLLISTPFILYLASQFTYGEMCIILASINLHSCIIGMLTKPSLLEQTIMKRTASSTKQKQHCITDIFNRMKSSFDINLLKDLPYMLFLLTLTLPTFASMLISVHFPNYVAKHGGTYEDINSIMVAFAFSNVVGRACGTAVVTWARSYMLNVQTVVYAISGLITASFPFYIHFPSSSYIFSVQLGFFIGLPSSMMTPMSNSFVGLSKISESYGFVYMFCGFGMALGPIVAGLLFAWTLSYSSSFILSGVMILLASFLGVLAQKFRKPVLFEVETKVKADDDDVDNELLGNTTV